MVIVTRLPNSLQRQYSVESHPRLQSEFHSLLIIYWRWRWLRGLLAGLKAFHLQVTRLDLAQVAITKHCYHLVAIGSPVSNDLVDSIQLLEESCLQELTPQFPLIGACVGQWKPNANKQVGVGLIQRDTCSVLL